MKKAFLLLPLILFNLLLAAHEKVDVVALCYDMGETTIFNELFQKLNEEDISYKVVVMGAASINTNRLTIDKNDIIDINTDFKVSPRIDPKDWERENALEEDQVNLATNHILSYQPQIILTGTNSKLQFQLAKKLKEYQSIKEVYCLYDNLNQLITDNNNFKTIERFPKNRMTMLVPSFCIAENIKKHFNTRVEIIGHPSLNSFEKNLKVLDESHIKKKLGLEPSQPVITYIGGYGKGYKESLELFAKSIKLIESTKKDLVTLIQIHPKFNNIPLEELEEYQALVKEECQSFIISQGKVNTFEAVAIANLCLSQSSTVIPQALCANKPCYFMDYLETPNTMIKSGVTRNILSPQDFLKTFKEVHYPAQVNIYEKAGIPQDSIAIMLSIVTEHLDKRKMKSVIAF